MSFSPVVSSSDTCGCDSSAVSGVCVDDSLVVSSLVDLDLRPRDPRRRRRRGVSSAVSSAVSVALSASVVASVVVVSSAVSFVLLSLVASSECDRFFERRSVCERVR
ncbi:DUF2637 domain-containing protein [Jonesia denitrificans]